MFYKQMDMKQRKKNDYGKWQTPKKENNGK